MTTSLGGFPTIRTSAEILDDLGVGAPDSPTARENLSPSVRGRFPPPFGTVPNEVAVSSVDGSNKAPLSTAARNRGTERALMQFALERRAEITAELGVVVTAVRAGSFRDLVKTPDDAYKLVDLLMAVSGNNATCAEMRVRYEVDLYQAMNAWLSPEPKWHSYPEPEALARAVFGNAWVEFVLPAHTNPHVEARLNVGAAIDKLRPAFLPGLVADQVELSSTPLPGV